MQTTGKSSLRTKETLSCVEVQERSKHANGTWVRAADLRRLTKRKEEGVRVPVALEPNPEAFYMPVSSSAEASAPQPRT